MKFAAADDDGFLVRRVRHGQMSLTWTNFTKILKYCPVPIMHHEVYFVYGWIYLFTSKEVWFHTLFRFQSKAAVEELIYFL